MATLLIALVLAGSALAQATQGASAGEPVGPHRRDRVVRVVRPGDTLWGIARALVGPEGDPRPTVDAIREANHLGSRALPAGTRLVLPAA